MDKSRLDEVHRFWFGELSRFDDFPQDKFPLWFVQDEAMDVEIRNRFGDLIGEAAEGNWRIDLLSPHQQLGLVILLDQLPRNAYRGTPRAYATDARARQIAREVAQDGLDRFKLIERMFLILPFGHSEDLADQDFALRLADEHYFPLAPADHFFTVNSRRQSLFYRDVIARFGRFPHRNAVLGRETSPDEARFMSETRATSV